MTKLLTQNQLAALSVLGALPAGHRQSWGGGYGSFRVAARALQKKGLVGWKVGVVPYDDEFWITHLGRKALKDLTP